MTTRGRQTLLTAARALLADLGRIIDALEADIADDKEVQELREEIERLNDHLLEFRRPT